MTMGRPKIEFDDKDWRVIDAACQYKTWAEDVAAILGCSEDTLSKRIKEKHGVTFTEYRRQKMAKTKHNLFAKQVDIALDGNVTMLIWLGKNMLDQVDKNEVIQSGTIAINIDSQDRDL